MDESRYSRNIALFGEDGQERIAGTSVAIVGLGGLGSHIVQQLAYLGVLRYRLVDGDFVTESSLNRVIGALPSDVVAKTSKLAVAERMVKTIQPEAEVLGERGWVTRSDNDDAAMLLRRSDLVFGCLDKESPRLVLTDHCSRYGLPYFDLATDTGGAEEDWYGGRVVSCIGDSCLSCLDLLDQRQIRLEQMTDEERQAEERLYGLEGRVLGASGPAIVSVNGVVASMAVTEFMAYVTGIRTPARQLTYRGDLPRVTSSRDAPRDGCPYCSRWTARA
ncbi:MAG: ThiF family adenylyltransferase [Actinomycetota bacterium]|nr:ThiF family adenylyltransferase [Actinomycetota bacterium]